MIRIATAALAACLALAGNAFAEDAMGKKDDRMAMEKKDAMGMKKKDTMAKKKPMKKDSMGMEKKDGMAPR